MTTHIHAQAKSNRRLATGAALVVVLMLAMSYAAVPLYDLFCRVTGYGGTTQIAQSAPTQIGTRMMTIRFDANTHRDMPWQFKPPADDVRLPVGAQGLTFFTAENNSNIPVTGVASFNVTPQKAGYYFSKIDCFCFTEQTLAAGERVDMPVSFFVSPEIVDDPELDDVDEITLSYTFFISPEKTQSASAGAGE